MQRRPHPQPWLNMAAALFQACGGQRIVEIGSQSATPADPNAQPDASSTLLWARIARELWTVALDPRATARTLAATGHASHVHAITMDGCEFLRQFQTPIDLLYLDAWETIAPHYKERHLEAYRAAKSNLHARSLILINDTDIDFGGKGSLVLAAALEDGFRIVAWGRQTLLARVLPAELGVRLPALGPPLPYGLPFPEAMKLHQQGFTWEAEHAYRQILQREPQHPGALHLLGVACYQRKDHVQAVSWIRQAIAKDDSKAVYHNNLGAALREQEQWAEARTAFERALAIRPDYADALSNLGLVEYDAGQLPAAERYWRQALRIEPRHVEALLHLSKLASQLHDQPQALQLADLGLKQQPDRRDLHLQRAHVLRELRRLDDAVAACEEALRIAPHDAEAHLSLGSIFAEQEREDDAERAFAAASQLRSENAFAKMRWASLCPTVFQSTASIDAFRARLSNELAVFARTPRQVPLSTLLRDAFFPSFYLVHQGRNNRPLKEQFAAIYEPLFPQRKPPPRTGKPRIGFLVTQGHEGGFLRCMGGIVERLDPRQFDVVILTSAAIVPRLQRLCRPGLHVLGFPQRLDAAIDAIQAAECDVIEHWQIGTDAMNYLLPFAPLAPAQSTSWGTHGTSGIRNVDYYVSSDLWELPDADAQYTEKLVRLPTIPAWHDRLPPPAPATRADFGLPEQARLYFCPHRLAKMHPDMDAIFAGILRQDPQGLILLKQGRYSYATAKLRERFQATLPDVCERIHVFPEQTTADFYRLFSLADVVLDPLHYSGGLMAYDTFALNLPLVILPGEFPVSRYSLAFYRKLGLPDLIVDSVASYIDCAVRVAKDHEWRRHLRLQLAERSSCLFEDEGAVQAYSNFFQQAIDESRAT